MPRITEISPQKRAKDRYNIFIDGNYSFSVSEEVLTKYKLKENIELSDENIREIMTVENLEKIFNKTLNFLSYRVRSRKEIEDRLAEYFYKANIKDDLSQKFKKEIITRLENAKLLNDSEFVQIIVEDAMSARIPKGKRKIKEFLLKRGVDRQIIDESLNVYPYEKEIEGANEELSKKMKTAKIEKNIKNKQKMWQFLARKGYSVEVINAVVDSKFEV